MDSLRCDWSTFQGSCASAGSPSLPFPLHCSEHGDRGKIISGVAGRVQLPPLQKRIPVCAHCSLCESLRLPTKSLSCELMSGFLEKAAKALPQFCGSNWSALRKDGHLKRSQQSTVSDGLSFNPTLRFYNIYKLRRGDSSIYIWPKWHQA